MDENKIQQQLDDLVEMVGVMSETMVTKEDLKQFATKEDLKQFATKDDLLRLENKVDSGFASVHSELEAIKREIGDIKDKLNALEKRTIEDANAASSEIVKLRDRVARLEKKLGIFDPAFA